MSTHNSKFRFYLKPIEGAVVFDEKVLQFVDREVVAELTKEVGQMNGLHWKAQKKSEFFIDFWKRRPLIYF